MAKCVVLFFVSILCIGGYAAGGIIIVSSEDADMAERFAARELGRYLEKITGSACGLRHQKGPDGFFMIVANRVPEIIERGPLEGDAYAVEPVKKAGVVCGLLLTGGRGRSTLYAVYDFLEHLGCRWYYPDPVDEIVPRMTVKEVLKIAASLSIRETPDFSIRMRRFLTYDITGPGHPLGDAIMAGLPRCIDWMAKNRINMFQYGLDHTPTCYRHWQSYRKVFGELKKRDMVIGAGGHSYFLFLPGEEFSRHRAWWPEKNGERTKAGQFCTGNREAVDFYISNIIGFLKENPEITYLTAWPADTGGWCECPRCRGISIADRYMRLGRETIERVNKVLPKVTFAHFAYGSHLEPPETERPAPGTAISVCTWGRDFSQTFPQMSASKAGKGGLFTKAFSTWRKICKEHDCSMILHEKYLRHLGLGFHPLPLAMLKGDIRYFKTQGLDGFELPMGFMGRRTKALNFYTTCRLLWDSRTDVDALVSDYFQKCYGAAADIMHRAYLHVERAQPDLRYFQEINKLHQDYVPIGQRYSQERLAYARKAVKGFESAGRAVTEALYATITEGQRGRIKRFAKSLHYVDVEYRGLCAMARAVQLLSTTDTAENAQEYQEAVTAAQRQLDEVRKYSRMRDGLRKKQPGDGFYWDITWKGPYCVFVDPDIDRVQKMVDAERAADFDSLPKTVWQIGVFDGGYADLGRFGADFGRSMRALPKATSFEINNGDRKQTKCPGFMPHHWPESLGHGASCAIGFTASHTGRYTLTVGQLPTGEAETVPVFLDGKRIGAYTTVPGEQHRHTISFPIDATGRHVLTLGAFPSGGGYGFDALKLTR